MMFFIVSDLSKQEIKLRQWILYFHHPPKSADCTIKGIEHLTLQCRSGQRTRIHFLIASKISPLQSLQQEEESLLSKIKTDSSCLSLLSYLNCWVNFEQRFFFLVLWFSFLVLLVFFLVFVFFFSFFFFSFGF